MTLTIYRVILLAITAASVFLVAALRSGGVAPEDFVNSQLPTEQLTFSDWRIYGHQEWALLAYRHLEAGNTPLAEKAAKQAFSINPGYGIAAGILMETYVQDRQYDKAEYMFGISAKLWPPRHKYLFESSDK